MSKQVFVSHNSKLPELESIVQFLTLIGVDPCVVEREVNHSLTPEQKTDHYLAACDAVLFLMTKDLVRRDGSWHPIANVTTELERAKSICKHKYFIYMLEDGCTFPTVQTEPVQIRFKWDKMLPALVDLLKELRSSGMIQTALPGTPDPTKTRAAPLSFEEGFILEVLGNQQRGWLPELTLLQVYLQEFQKDVAEFNMLINDLKGKGLVECIEIGMGHPGYPGTAVQIRSLGFAALRSYRTTRKSDETKGMLSLLAKLGVVSAVPGTEGTHIGSST